MSYQYKCVPFPMNIALSKSQTLDTAINGYQEKINNLANDGWEYVGSDHLATTQNPGCLSGLFGGQAVAIQHKFIIFRKPL
jgi:hypothetical protein